MHEYISSQRHETEQTAPAFNAWSPLKTPLTELTEAKRVELGSQIHRSKGDVINYAVNNITFNGSNFEMQQYDTRHKNGAFTTTWIANKRKGLLTLEIMGSYRHNRIELSTWTLKEDENLDLPKGLGIEMYKKALNIMQEIANTENSPVRHHVYRAPDISDTPMSEERWGQLFIPILLKNGYHEFVPGEWEKIYNVETRNAKAA